MFLLLGRVVECLTQGVLSFQLALLLSPVQFSLFCFVLYCPRSSPRGALSMPIDIRLGLQPERFCVAILKAQHTTEQGALVWDLQDTSDLSGRITPSSVGGAQYYDVKFIDGFSSYRWIYLCQIHWSFPSYRWIYLLKHKKDFIKIFKQFKTLVENQSSKKIKFLVSDGGREYINHEMDTLCKESGLTHQVTAPHTPQQNPISERGNRTSVKKARTMIAQSSLPTSFWRKAVTTATYLENRTPSSAACFRTPFERINNQIPNVNHIKFKVVLHTNTTSKPQRKI